MSSYVVVGAGICGLTAAILLAKKFDKVTLIEQASHCGGLLQTVTDDAGHSYDQGTHIPETTGIKEIDDILFCDQHSQQWQPVEKLRTGNYFADSWDLNTQTIDARKLPPEVYHLGLGEFMDCTAVPNDLDIESYLTKSLGSTFYQELALPVIRKLYGQDVDPSTLTAKTGVNYFGAGRIIAFNQRLTALLKQDVVFDAKLGFHHQGEYESLLIQKGVTLPDFYYPTSGQRVQFWTDCLLQKAKDLGVEVITSTSVTHIEHANGNIYGLKLSDDKVIDCDFLFWSVPPVFALKAADLEIKKTNVSFRTAHLLHYTFDTQLLNTQSHYIWNWDPAIPFFRATLYQNLSVDSLPQVTLEYLSGAQELTEYDLEKGMKNLVKMGLISAETKLVSSLVQRIDNTFPVPTFEFEKSTQDNYDVLNNALDNIVISGRLSGKCWLQGDVLRKAYHDINTLTSESQ
jgi:protoporphyrinogen oxidase